MKYSVPPLALVVFLAGCAVGEAPSPKMLQLTTQADYAYQHEEWKKAEGLYHELRDRKSRDPLIYFRLGNIYAQTHQYQKAIRMYARSLKEKPDDAPAWRNLGVIHLRQGLAALRESQLLLEEENPIYIRNAQMIQTLQRIADVSAPAPATETSHAE